ncbi:MAG TPA: VPLPA-CTERM sorting domain-containing protein, partial [Paracoccaceae bacterium]|nr:VPLPA-CTERM sorting domain-containing protein [Paracoccaceae bacterium]
VNALFSTSFSGLDLNDKDQSAGFQLALWEVLFEKKNDWDLGKGTFHVTGFGGAVTAAHDMLTATLDFIDNGVKGDNFVNYELTWLQASNGGQNLVTAVAVSPIPLPAAGPMLIFSLAGLGYLARRRKQAEA